MAHGHTAWNRIVEVKKKKGSLIGLIIQQNIYHIMIG